MKWREEDAAKFKKVIPTRYKKYSNYIFSNKPGEICFDRYTNKSLDELLKELWQIFSISFYYKELGLQACVILLNARCLVQEGSDYWLGPLWKSSHHHPLTGEGQVGIFGGFKKAVVWWTNLKGLKRDTYPFDQTRVRFFKFHLKRKWG